METNPSATVEKKESSLKEIFKFVIITLAVIVPLRLYIAEPFFVNGASMDPTFKNSEYLIVDRLSYYFEKPARESVLILKYPRDTSLYFIKRVIGLPGETVMINNGRVTIVNKDHPDGMILEEPYIAENHALSDSYRITLTPTEYFVMGDNRAQSSDSRAWGPLDEKYIVGRPFIRLFPFGKMAILPGAVQE